MRCPRKLVAFGGLITLLTLSSLLAQQTASSDDIQASLRSCRIVKLTLQARERRDNESTSDNFASAGQACERLNAAVATSDPKRIQSAAAELRPLLARLAMPPATPQEQLAALENASAGASERDRCYNLPDLAKRAFNAGDLQKAEIYSRELLKMAPDYPKDWNNGNAIFYGNFVLGRLALRRGDVKGADAYLLQSGRTPGSPQLDSFGPSMTLAKELLDKGESQTVLEYLAICKRFWELDRGKLDEWSTAIHNGEIPSFEGQLDY
ncbi:MAG TPA: hypothetical protein VL240_00725 [Candidatus Binatia bacterium]|nr:hypothetical protein [Candidatus Binatia bacterium]